jgi:hypothetical protein
LLRSDERGHRNAIARRIGITYIIWNHRIYRVGSDDAHWRPYGSTADPHDTHVHFSFSVAGAARTTSWWTDRAVPVVGDWDGDGRDTVAEYDSASRRFSVRTAATGGGPAVTTPPIGPFGAMPLAGNWDGAGGDELGVYEPLARRFSFHSIAGAAVRPPTVFGSAGDLPIVGDWDGDGVDDIGTYTPDSGTFARLLADGSVRREVFGRPNDTPVAGDWDGDGVDDIGALRSSHHTFFAALSAGDGRLAIRSVDYGASRDLPKIGDWDGNGIDKEDLVSAR